MDAYKRRVEELAELMSEFGLSEAELEGEGWKISLRKTKPAAQVVTMAAIDAGAPVAESVTFEEEVPAVSAPPGIPVTSPMTGIYYSAPSPSSPPFVKEGDTVSAGQVVGLIEAMKVFNEITATMSGTVVKIAAESGQLVNPGDPLLYVR